ncbi:hypothetical protein QBC43DRAFT_355930 [Cladorrhinum sp. PSN259]|nr:hypothetical protein QBC43DRAFT_355930 [Cladorrhinum sp. PSN259]
MPDNATTQTRINDDSVEKDGSRLAYERGQEHFHDRVLSKVEPKLIYHLLTCLWERQLFVTELEDGVEHIGLAPRHAAIGDEIHVIPDCPAPFILRRLDHGSDESSAGRGKFEVGDWKTDTLA